MFCKFSLFSLFFFTALTLTGQEFGDGQISPSDVHMTTYPTDSTAEAVVLYDGMDLSIEPTATGYKLFNLRHRRVKLLRESAFDRANVELLYRRGDERIEDLQAMIILPNGQKIELDRDDFIRERESDDFYVLRFAFPQVTVGAILEYRYRRIDSYLTQLPTYYFQEDIPVRFAEFKADLRARFSYLVLSNAFPNMCIKKEERVMASISLPYAGRNSHLSSVRYHYAMCEAPAFQAEPYVDNLRDYLPNVKFQLAEFQNLSRGVDEVLGTWESSADELMKDPNVGMRFNRDSKFRLIQEEIGPLLGANQREQAQYALDRVNEHMDWNGEYRFTSDVSVKDAWKATVGNSAVINMILLGTLRANGIEAEPLLVGLRDDGRPIQEYPVISQFSHFMVLAHLDGEPTIIDANGSRGTVGLPRVRALNGFAWVLSIRNHRWIPIETEQMLEVTRVEATLAESGMATINSTTERLGYYRQSGLSDLEEESDEPEGPILDYYLEKFPETEFLNRSYSVGENSSDPLTINLQVKAPIGQPSGDYLYLSPVFTNFLQRALIENEERQFPIDFIFPWRKIISTDIQIPEGYVLDELPNNRRIQTENGSIQAHLYFQHFAASNKLAVNFSVRINQDSFHPNDYSMLREIFQEIIDLQEAIIVLKRGNAGDIGAN